MPYTSSILLNQNVRNNASIIEVESKEVRHNTKHPTKEIKGKIVEVQLQNLHTNNKIKNTFELDGINDLRKTKSDAFFDGMQGSKKTERTIKQYHQEKSRNQKASIDNLQKLAKKMGFSKSITLHSKMDKSYTCKGLSMNKANKSLRLKKRGSMFLVKFYQAVKEKEILSNRIKLGTFGMTRNISVKIVL